METKKLAVPIFKSRTKYLMSAAAFLDMMDAVKTVRKRVKNII